MGNDGGSIPRRRELVKTKKREEKIEAYAVAKAKANFCALTEEPLREPIMVCRLGHLYNKEDLLKRLLEKSMPHNLRHIRRLKDVREAKAQTKENSDHTITIVCPVSAIEFNGFNRFIMAWPCGCVMSEEAAQELKLEDKCLQCGIDINK